MSLPTTRAVLAPSRAGWRALALDYLELTKPKIAALELVTVAVAAFVAGWVPANPQVH